MEQVLKYGMNTIPNYAMVRSDARYHGAPWYEKAKNASIIILGCGGIGSHLALCLSKTSPARLDLVDMDTVDDTNLSGQAYMQYDIGVQKVVALSQLIKAFGYQRCVSAINRTLHNVAISDYQVVFTGLDNMEARKEAFTKWKTSNKDHSGALFVDGRMAAEHLIVLAVYGGDEYSIKNYEENWLFDDSEAEETVCSYKQTYYCANMIAGFMTNVYVNFLASMCDSGEARKPKNSIELNRTKPLVIDYDCVTMNLKIEQ